MLDFAQQMTGFSAGLPPDCHPREFSAGRSPTQPIREIAQVSLGGGPQSGVMAFKIAQFAAPLAPPTRKLRKLAIHTSRVLNRVIETPQLVHGCGTANSLCRNSQFRKLSHPRGSSLARYRFGGTLFL